MTSTQSATDGIPSRRVHLKAVALASAVALAAFAASAPGAPALAQTSTAPFTVTATVQATCSNTASPMAFGPYTGAIATATGDVTVTCSATTPYNIGLSAGNFPTATVTTRHMVGTDPAGLGYVLTSDALHAVNWGDTVGTDTVALIGTGAGTTTTIYGQVAAAQLIAPGVYEDTITATVTY